MRISKFDQALYFGNSLFFYYEIPSKFSVEVMEIYLERIWDIIHSHIGNNNALTISNLRMPIKLYFRNQQSLNLFKLVAPKSYYV